jgi:AcrR family transcriptional regulator
VGDDARGGRDRSRQKRRTRRAILAAAVELMRQGETPTANRVAEVAEVSRRTVYLYFPTQEQLLTEAALEGVRAEVDRAVELADSDDVEARLDALVAAALRGSIESEVLLRTMIRLTIEHRLDEVRGGPPREAPLRGGRRIEVIEEALAPVRERLGEARFDRLVSALALVVGIEALLVLRDIRGLDHAAMEEVSRWSARALLRASLAEQA